MPLVSTTRNLSGSLFVLVLMICLSSSLVAQDVQEGAGIPYPGEDPWWDSVQGKIGHKTGDLTDRYGDGEGDGQQEPAGGGPKPGASGVAQGPAASTVAIDPANSGHANLIVEWIRIAEPPENATERARFRYSNRGAKIGIAGDGGIIKAPHDPGVPDPVWLWTNQRFLNSVNHCTMEEYVHARAAEKPFDHCRGRYKPERKPEISPTEAQVATAEKVLENCNLAAISTQIEVLSAARFANDAAAGNVLAKLKRELQAKQDLEEVRKTLAGGDLGGAKSRLQKLPPSSCIAKGPIDELGREIADLERILADAEKALQTCEASQVIAAADRLSKRNHAALASTKKSLDAMVAVSKQVTDLQAEAKKDYATGDIKDAKQKLERSLASLDKVKKLSVCSDARDSIAKNLDKIARLTKAIAEADAAINRCDAARMRALSQQFVKLNQPSLNAAKERMDRVAEAIDQYEEAKQLYQDGDLQAAESGLKRARSEIKRAGAQCPDRTKRIASNLDKIARLGDAAAKAEAAIDNCNIAGMRTLSQQFAKVGHPRLNPLKGRMDRLLAVENQYDKAKRLYASGDLQAAKAQLERTRSSLSATGMQCPDLTARIASSLDKIARIVDAESSAEAAIASCDVRRMQALSQQFARANHARLNVLKNRMDAIVSREARTKSLFAEANRLAKNRDFNAALSKLEAAKSNTGCDRYGPKINDAIAKVRDAMNKVAAASRNRRPPPRPPVIEPSRPPPPQPRAQPQPPPPPAPVARNNSPSLPPGVKSIWALTPGTCRGEAPTATSKNDGRIARYRNGDLGSMDHAGRLGRRGVGKVQGNSLIAIEGGEEQVVATIVQRHADHIVLRWHDGETEDLPVYLCAGIPGPGP